MKSVCLLLVGALTSASALVSSYHVEPKTAAMSGKVPGNPEYGGVSEVITCNFDSLAYVELFSGTKNGNGAIQVNVYEYPDGSWVASSNQKTPGEHQWVLLDTFG